MKRTMDSTKTKFLQINLQKSRSNTLDILKHIEEKNIDIALIQEPYMYFNRIVNLNTNWIAVYSKNNNPKSIIIIKRSLQILCLDYLIEENIVVIKVKDGNREVCIVSIYIPPKDNIEEYISKLERLCNINREDEKIIGGDFNAKSSLWYSKSTDDKGELIEEFIVNNNLIVLNKEGEKYTYDSIHGQDNIDITLVTEGIENKSRGWNVEEGISDHNIISWEVGMEAVESTNENKIHVGITDWDGVRRDIDRRLKLINISDIEEKIKAVSGIIREVCKKYGKRRGKKNCGTWWWSKELEEKKAEVKRLNRRYRRCCICDSREEYKEEYKISRRTYKKMIRDKMQESWMDFLREESRKSIWNIPDKIYRGKLKKKELIGSIKVGETYTNTIEETYMALVNYLLPHGDIPGDNILNEVEIQVMEEEEIEDGIQIEEVELALRNSSMKKAPGLDEVTVEALKQVWEVVKEDILNIIRSSYNEGIFPKEWKRARLTMFHKGNNKSKEIPSSYRPICLISVLGKIYERVILNRITKAVEEELSEEQYGFRKGRSTEKAVDTVMSIIKTSEKEYVLAILIDIKNAFSTMRWEKVKNQIRRLKIKEKEKKILNNYMKDREVVLNIGDIEIRMEMDRGCPQGSVLGPTLWNMVFNTYLKIPKRENCNTVAYADDCIIIVHSDTRQKLEDAANNEMRILSAWMDDNNLQLSVEKTKMILVKGKLKRMPVVKYNNKTISSAQEVNYLGVIIDTRLTFLPHMKKLADKLKTLFIRLRQKLWSNIKYNELNIKMLYNALYLNIVKYASIIYEDNINNSYIIRNLRALQRTILISLYKTNKTISYSSIITLNKIVPIELEIANKNRIFRIYNTNGQITYNNHNYRKIETEDKIWIAIDDINFVGYKEMKKIMKRDAISKWSEEYKTNDKSLEVKNYIKNVEEFYDSKITLNDKVREIISGHAQIKSYLYRINKVDDNICQCGIGIQDIYHILYTCEMFVEERAELKSKLAVVKETWPLSIYTIYRREVYKIIEEYMLNIYKIVKTLNDDLEG